MSAPTTANLLSPCGTLSSEAERVRGRSAALARSSSEPVTLVFVRLNAFICLKFLKPTVGQAGRQAGKGLALESRQADELDKTVYVGLYPAEQALHPSWGDLSTDNCTTLYTYDHRKVLQLVQLNVFNGHHHIIVYYASKERGLRQHRLHIIYTQVMLYKLKTEKNVLIGPHCIDFL